MATGTAAGQRAARDRPSDRGIVVRQMYVGAGLVGFGAILVGIYAVAFKVVGIELTTPTGSPSGGAGLTILGTVAVSTATAVIGAGAALLPSGAAATASYRILQSLPSSGPQPPDVVTGSSADKGGGIATVMGTVNPHGQTVAYFFRYGASKVTPPEVAPAGSTAQQVSADVPLAKGETYELVATIGAIDVSGGRATY